MARKKYRKPIKRSFSASSQATLLRGALLIIGLFLAAWGGSMLLQNNGNNTNNGNTNNSNTVIDDADAAPVVGAHAPDFIAKTLSGGKIHLRDLRGKPVVLNFWATWCPPCRAEMPMFQEYYTAHAGEYVMIAVNDAEPPEQVRDFIEQQGFTFTVVLDPQQTIVSKYRIQGFPTTFFIDAEGVIRYSHVGMLNEGILIRGLYRIGVTP